MAPVLHQDRVVAHGPAWVEAGIISDRQLASIRHFEQLDERDDRTLSVGAEVAVYLGSVLALTGGGIVAGRYWDDLAFPARLAIAAVLAGVGIVAGAWSYRQSEPGTDRLGGFLTTVGIAGIAFAVGLVVHRLDPVAEEMIAVVPGLAVVGVAAVLWRNRSRPLELLSIIAGGLVASLAMLSLVDAAAWVAGVWLLAAGGLVAVGAGLGRIRPCAMGVAAGAAVAYGGGFVLIDVNEHLGPAVALGVATALVTWATRADAVPLLVLGVIGALAATEAVLATTFEGAVAASLVAVIGVAIVVAVIARSVHLRPSSPSAPDL